MTQGEIEKLTVKTQNIFSRLEIRIMQDIIRRVKENGFVTASADWQISRLKQLGESEQTIRQLIQDALGASDAELEHIFSDEVYEEYYGHAHAYEIAGVQQIPYEENEALQRTVEAMKLQLRGEYQNLTGSMGFAIRGADGLIKYSPVMSFYRTTLDNAVADIHSGAFDYNTVLKRTVTTLTNSGLRYINYESGHRDRVDVAVRRAVLTGFRQVQGKINEQVAAELHTDMYEVTYHVGARPSHQPWQGRVWIMEQLQSVCGLGTGSGLCGWNCYHDYRPFPPGSVRTYTDEQLEAMLEQENTPKEYSGKQYTTYEALQQQRKMERTMRAQRQKIKLLEEGGADPDDVILARAKYQGQMQNYAAFSKKMNLPEQKARIMQDGLRGRFMPTKEELKQMAVPGLKNAAGKPIIEVKRATLIAEPNSITQVTKKKGGVERNYYDQTGRQYKQISNNNHGNAKQHPYGVNGEHAHDYVYEEGELVDRPTRELTEDERKENEDIL